jgi:hypothetical protein
MKWQDRELLQVRQLVSEGDLNETHRVATLRFSCHQNEASVPRTLLGAWRSPPCCGVEAIEETGVRLVFDFL